MSSKSNKEGFYTLKDLAEYCRDVALTGKDVSGLLSDKLIVWLRDDLGEKEISQKVRDIISQETAYSEKVYRFLKLCGVFSARELTEVFKKIRVRELQEEKEARIIELRNEAMRRINVRRSLLWRGVTDEAIRSAIAWGSLSLLVAGIIMAIVS